MTNIFDFTDYRELLLSIVKHRTARGGTQASLAEAMGCQAAYFSQVLKGRGELTEDHIIGLCEYLELDENSSEYFLLLLRTSRAGTNKLRSYLKKQSKKLAEKSKLLENRLQASKDISNEALGIYYCSSWIPSLLHVATSCEDLQTIKQLKARFNLPEDLIETHLRDLEKFDLVAFDQGRWKYAGGSMHFPKSSPLDQQLQLGRRQLSSQSIPLRRTDDLNYSVVFACDQETKKLIHAKFLETIDFIHKTVEPSPSEEVFTICIDFFKPS